MSIYCFQTKLEARVEVNMISIENFWEVALLLESVLNPKIFSVQKYLNLVWIQTNLSITFKAKRMR